MTDMSALDWFLNKPEPVTYMVDGQVVEPYSAFELARIHLHVDRTGEYPASVSARRLRATELDFEASGIPVVADE